jgi:hypothetical protein
MYIFRSRIRPTTAELLAVFVLLFVFAIPSFAQADVQAPGPLTAAEKDRLHQPKTVRDYLAKKRTEKSKREYEELLKQGEQAVVLSAELEEAGGDGQLTPADQSKLESLEKLVAKIRKGLGGEDDDDEKEHSGAPAPTPGPAGLRESLSNLKDLTSQLMDELKKTTRFTVSVVAIQSSNSVLSLVRFLRFKR